MKMTLFWSVAAIVIWGQCFAGEVTAIKDLTLNEVNVDQDAEIDGAVVGVWFGDSQANDSNLSDWQKVNYECTVHEHSDGLKGKVVTVVSGQLKHEGPHQTFFVKLEQFTGPTELLFEVAAILPDGMRLEARDVKTYKP